MPTFCPRSDTFRFIKIIVNFDKSFPRHMRNRIEKDIFFLFFFIAIIVVVQYLAMGLKLKKFSYRIDKWYEFQRV